MLHPRNVAVLLFDDVGLLDFCGPYEVFSVANKGRESPAFVVYTVAEEIRPLRGGPLVVADYTLDECPPADVLIVPGGYGTGVQLHHAALLRWLRQTAERAEVVLSVCTGSLLLGKAGLLDGLAATSHHDALALLRRVAPRAAVRDDCRYIDNGKFVIAAGITAGIDASLYLIERLHGSEDARDAAAHLEYQGYSSSVTDSHLAGSAKRLAGV